MHSVNNCELSPAGILGEAKKGDMRAGSEIRHTQPHASLITDKLLALASDFSEPRFLSLGNGGSKSPTQKNV